MSKAQHMHERLLERLTGTFDGKDFITNELDIAAAIEISKERTVTYLSTIVNEPHEYWIISNPTHTAYMFYRGYEIGLREGKKNG